VASHALARAVVITTVVAVLLSAAGNCTAQSLFTENGPFSGSLFADVKARDVGDIVTIVVFEDARASSRTSKTTDKGVEGGIAAGTGLLSFIPAAGMELESGSKGAETLAQSGSLTATVTARIVERLDNGYLRIEGTRRVTVNGEQQELVVSGIIRERDISPDNTIPSTLVADAEIRFTGQPEFKKSDSVLSRIWNGLLGIIQWIF
jgi:flagellar L-ring protein precursor FlgH